MENRRLFIPKRQLAAFVLMVRVVVVIWRLAAARAQRSPTTDDVERSRVRPSPLLPPLAIHSVFGIF